MLPKSHRLTKEKDFKRVYSHGRFFSLGFVMAKILRNELDVSRFGIVVGTKVSKKATKRNRVKRRLREAIRLKLDRIKPRFDVVVMVKPEIVDKSYQEIDKAVTKLLKKTKLL